MGNFTCTYIPEFYLRIPASRQHHVWILLEESAREYFIRVSWSNLVSKCLQFSHSLLVPNFKSWLSTSDAESAAILRVIYGMVPMILIKSQMFDCI